MSNVGGGTRILQIGMVIEVSTLPHLISTCSFVATMEYCISA